MAPRLKSLYIVFIKYSQRGDKLAATSAGFPLPALPVVCEAIGSDRWLGGSWSDRWQTGGLLLGQTGGWLAGQTGGWVGDGQTGGRQVVGCLVTNCYCQRGVRQEDRQVFALYDRWLVLCCLLVRQVVGCLCMVYGLWGIQVFVLY